MDPTSYLGKTILSVLNDLRESEEIIDYSKVDGDEFLKLQEKGYYLHSKNGDGIIFDCRIYLAACDEYFPSATTARGKFASVVSIADLEELLGPSKHEIKSIRIPTRPPTLSGKEFVDGDRIVKAFYESEGEIRYLHITTIDLS